MDLSRICAKDKLGERIYEIRKQNEYSQEEFADLLGVPRNAVSRWETNKQKPNSEDIIKIARKFDISCDTILMGVMPKHIEINQITGLNEKSIECLNNIKKSRKSLMNTINIVFSNLNVATVLFKCIDLYAHLIIPKVVEYENGTRVGRLSTHFTDEETLFKFAISEQIFKILSYVRKTYFDKRCNIYEKYEEEYIFELEEKLKEITIATKEFEPKALRDLTFDEDESI